MSFRSLISKHFTSATITICLCNMPTLMQLDRHSCLAEVWSKVCKTTDIHNSSLAFCADKICRFLSGAHMPIFSGAQTISYLCKMMCKRCKLQTLLTVCNVDATMNLRCRSTNNSSLSLCADNHIMRKNYNKVYAKWFANNAHFKHSDCKRC